MQNWLRIASQWDDLAEVADKHPLRPAPYLVGFALHNHKPLVGLMNAQDYS